MLRSEFYDILTTVLNRDFFEFNSIDKRVSVSLPYTWETVLDARKQILSILGNINIAMPDWENDPLKANYKINAHFLDVDEATIKIDNFGRLTANIEDYKTTIKEELLKDEEFLKELLAAALEKGITETPSESCYYCNYYKPKPITP